MPTFSISSADNRFFTKAFEAAVSFDKPAGNGASDSATWQQNGRDQPLRRITRETPSAEALSSCTGDFYSDELRTLYRLTLRDGKLMLRYARGELELQPVTRDVFPAAFPLGTVAFERGATNTCDGFRVTTGRARNLRFMRVLLPAAG